MGKDYFSPQTRRFAHLPHAPCVYAAELSTGLVKVGRSSSARARMMSLRNEVALHHGAQLQRFRIVERASEASASATELRLIKALAAIGERIPGRAEFFSGVSFEEAADALDRVSAPSQWAETRETVAYIVNSERISHERVLVVNFQEV